MELHHFLWHQSRELTTKEASASHHSTPVHRSPRVTQPKHEPKQSTKQISNRAKASPKSNAQVLAWHVRASETCRSPIAPFLSPSSRLALSLLASLPFPSASTCSNSSPLPSRAPASRIFSSLPSSETLARHALPRHHAGEGGPRGRKNGGQ